MGMGICLARFAMSGPTGMGDTDRPGNIFLGNKLLQLGNLPFGFVNVQLAIFIDQCHTCAVITSVFQPFQSFDKNRVSISFTDVTYYSTHTYLFFGCKYTNMRLHIERSFRK